jgi:arylsulfatase A-like enzyme
VEVSRRRFLQASAAVAAGVTLPSACAGPDQRRARASGPDRPNVLLVVIDSLRADAVYENAVHTPNMGALIDEGVRFTNTFPEAMPTVPARNSIFSGHRIFPFRGWHDYPGLIQKPGWSPLHDVHNALPAVLGRAGYWTSYVSDNPFFGWSSSYAPFRQSIDHIARTGGQIGGLRPVSSVPDRVLRHWLHPASLDPKARRRVGLYLANSRSWEDPRKTYAARVFGNAMTVLDDARKKRPFAMIVDSYEPHEPWTPPPQFLRQYGDPDWRGPEPAMLRYGRSDNWLEPGEQGAVIGRLRDLYAAEVTMTDLWLGRLIDRLHDHGLERETIIVLIADHGILLGEHGWTGKIQTALYPTLTRVPFIVIDPSRRYAGRTSHFFASTHDVAPTILSMADVQAPEKMTGADLSRVFGDRPLPERPYAYGGYSDSFYIRSKRWALWAWNKPMSFKLYDLERDPGYNHNVADRHPAVVKDLYGKVLARAGGRLPYYDVERGS